MEGDVCRVVHTRWVGAGVDGSIFPVSSATRAFILATLDSIANKEFSKGFWINPWDNYVLSSDGVSPSPSLSSVLSPWLCLMALSFCNLAARSAAFFLI